MGLISMAIFWCSGGIAVAERNGGGCWLEEEVEFVAGRRQGREKCVWRVRVSLCLR